MNDEVTDTVTDVISVRTTHVIAAEINMIKYQAERIYLDAAVEIGWRLTEAKALLKYGEWGAIHPRYGYRGNDQTGTQASSSRRRCAVRKVDDEEEICFPGHYRAG